MAAKFLEKFHDPKVQRSIFIQRIVAYIVDYLKPFQVLGIQDDQQLLRLQNRIELDVLKYGRETGAWTERELPLRVKLQYHKGKMHVDFNGPLGGEVFVAMQDYMNFRTPIGPIGGFEEYDDDDDDDDGDEGGFHYGR